jgi:uncharacterized membrane protein required for colicin V production
MSTRESDTATTIAAIAAIAIIIGIACLCGIDDTLVKLGIAAIASIAGFSFRDLVRKP